jgi:hypothetical protein
VLGGRGGVGGWVGGALGYYMCVCVCAFYYIFACLLVHIHPSLFLHTYIYTSIYIERDHTVYVQPRQFFVVY